MPGAELPDGFRVGHHTDARGLTGCTVVLPPPGGVGACEVRGGGPATRESDLLSPAAGTPGVHAVLLTGGSAFGLAAAEGAVAWLAERGVGHPTPAALVPLVPAAVVYDLMLGDGAARPGAAAGYAACAAASSEVPRGSVGAGTGYTVGKLRGPGSWTRGGLGLARAEVGDAVVVALAVVNAFGDVLAEDGSVLAGVWEGSAYTRSVDLLRRGEVPPPRPGEATTLVCLMTDAALTKTQAWLVARAAGAGVARAVDPVATERDGDVVYCLAAGGAEVEPTRPCRGGRPRDLGGDPGRRPRGLRRPGLPGGLGAPPRRIGQDHRPHTVARGGARAVTTHSIAVIPGDGIGNEVVPEGHARARARRAQLDASLSSGTSSTGAATHYLEARPHDARGRARAAARRTRRSSSARSAIPRVPDHVSLWGLLIPIRRTFRST